MDAKTMCSSAQFPTQNSSNSVCWPNFQSWHSRRMGDNYQVNHVSIEITGLNRKLASSIKDKLLDESPSSVENCIFKVPDRLRGNYGHLYDPNIVAIGPYHHDNVKLAGMEYIKMWYLNDMLGRFPLSPEEILESIIESIRELGMQAREYYSNLFNLPEDEFIEMLVVDGCFLIELFRKHAYLVPRHKDDPIFNTSWMHENLYHDLILIENQIPWLILQRLFELTVSVNEQEPYFLVELVLKFFEKMMLMTVPAEFQQNEKEIKHILDLLRSCILSTSGCRKPNSTKLELFSPVTDLLQAGVQFKKGTADNILNIKFSNGVFKIPPIRICWNSEAFFRNIIAYEQCDSNCTDQFTSYAIVLDCLIDISKDADLLIDEGIILNAMSTQDISCLFNRLYNHTLLCEFYYEEVAHQVNEYYRSQWSRWRGTLKRDYFNTPWSICSFIAAILVLAFTFLQTLFTILSYHS